MILENKHPVQARTLKLHLNLCNNHHCGRVTTIQRLRSTILLPKLARKMSLAFLEAINTTYALILILIIQKYTKIDVCTILFQPLFMCRSYCPFSLFFPFLSAHILFFGGQTRLNRNHQQLDNGIKHSLT